MAGCFMSQWRKDGGREGVFQMGEASFLSGGVPHGGHRF